MKHSTSVSAATPRPHPTRLRTAVRLVCIGACTTTGGQLALHYWQARVNCPPAREGGVQCLLYSRWGPALTVVALGPLVGVALARLLLDAPRAPIARWRAGERLRLGRAPYQDALSGAARDDPLLFAASWGYVGGGRRRERSVWVPSGASKTSPSRLAPPSPLRRPTPTGPP